MIYNNKDYKLHITNYKKEWGKQKEKESFAAYLQVLDRSDVIQRRAVFTLVVVIDH